MKALLLNVTDIHISHQRVIYNRNRTWLKEEPMTSSLFIEIKNFLKLFCQLNLMENIDESGTFYINFIGNILGVRVSFFEGVNDLNSNSSLISLRFLYKHPTNCNLMRNEDMEWLVNIISKPGLIVIAGTTGRGKTTFMYNFLQMLIEIKPMIIITAEDPVERIVPGIFQRETSGELESVVKSILRHNPDLIVIGEIRDKNTAAMCIRAALTGHGVLCTVHLNVDNTLENFLHRFEELGVERKYLVNSVKGFVELLPNYEYRLLKMI